MKLLLVPDPTSPNGDDAFCREIAKRSSARGHQATIQAVPSGPDQISLLARLSATGFALSADAVLINSLQPTPFLAAKAAGRKTALRLIETYAGLSPESLAGVQKMALSADLLLVPSRHMADLVHSWGANGSVHHVPYAYDRIMAQQIALVTLRASRPTGFQIIAAGRFTESNRAAYETLLSAVARLRLDCHLSLIGDGPALPALKARVQLLVAGDRVSFLGPLPHPKIMEYFRAAKAFVEPYGLDGFPTLALHALSEGCPVIAPRAGACVEVIRDGKNGLLFSPGDVLGLSEAIVTLYSVRGLALTLITEGIRTVEAHTWDATVEAAFSALEKLR
ncbi:MAG: glycosyltransferase [Elusimicrobiota bacterium]